MMRLFVLLFALTSSSSGLLADESSRVSPDQCRELLVTSIVDFYLPHCVDDRYGGYLENIDETGTFVGEEKFLTLQARHVWFFSAIAKAGIRREQALAAAASGYAFLNEHFYDEKNGGYFTKVARDGVPTDRRKHVYPLSFVVYALVEYAEASGQSEPLAQALKLFDQLETHCHDPLHGGYNEFFYDDWRPITDPSEAGYIGAIGTKTYNSHLHLMEAFTSLYRATQDERVKARLIELVQINTVAVKHPAVACNIDGWNPDWSMIATPTNLRASYGHDVECVWLVLDAVDALGLPKGPLLGWARALTDNALQYGFDPDHGGFYYTGPLTAPSDDRKKEWWVQSEALVCLMTMHGLTGEDRYRNSFAQTFEFVTKYQVAPRGGWWATVNSDGSPIENPSRTSMWHGAYHNGRALLLCEKLLRESP